MSSERQYFGTDGIRGRTGEFPITAEFALKLGWAIGQVLAKDGRGKVLIGKDTRISGYMLSAALEAGLISSGLDVCLLGPIPTPGVAYLTQQLSARAGIVVSASHNPYYDNGIKIFSEKGTKLADPIEIAIESYLSKPMTTVDAKLLGKAKMLSNATQDYIQFCQKTFLPHQTLKGLKIILDCANGATYHIAPEVFKTLGAEVISIHVEPDGFNINENCGSTHPENLQVAVRAHQADLGIAFDGDGDRVLFVDHMAEIVDGDELLFIMTRFYQQQNRLNGGVVGTLMSNLGLEKALAELNIPFVRTKVGDRYVADELRQRQWCLGGESSGHLLCLDKTSTGDGIISALQVLNSMLQLEQSLHDLKKGMTKCAQVLLNVRVNSAANVVQDPRMQAAVADSEQFLGKKGRVLLRPSGTEPVVRVMVEGDEQSLIEKVAQDLAEKVKEFSN